MTVEMEPSLAWMQNVKFSSDLPADRNIRTRKLMLSHQELNSNRD
jgi:hypothetical protein